MFRGTVVRDVKRVDAWIAENIVFALKLQVDRVSLSILKSFTESRAFVQYTSAYWPNSGSQHIARSIFRESADI